MAKCAFCGKETSFGKQLSITRSHISKRSTRTVKPNLRTVKAVINGEVKFDPTKGIRESMMADSSFNWANARPGACTFFACLRRIV